MMETTPGKKYVGYYTVPIHIYADGAMVEMKAVEGFGNEARGAGRGKVVCELEVGWSE